MLIILVQYFFGSFRVVCEDGAANRARDLLLEHGVDAVAMENVVAMRELSYGVCISKL